MKKALVRGIIPFVILMGIALLLWTQGETEQARDTFFAGLIFTIVGMTTVVYEYDQWTILKKSVVHFTLMLLTVYPLLLLSGWFALDQLSDYLLVFILFLGVGVLS